MVTPCRTPPSSINISALSIRPHLKITQIKGAAVITVALANGGRADQRACRFIHPCQPIVAKQPPAGPGWAHELKHDGYRLQIHVRDGASSCTHALLV